MAAKTEKTLERTYTIPLRKEFQKVPRWRKTKKAVAAVKQFLTKHMKSENVKLSTSLNEKLWNHGIRNPPHKIKVNVTKDSEGKVTAELFGVKAKKEKADTKKKAPKKEVKETLKEVAKKEESKQEQAALEKEQPQPKVEKLPQKEKKDTQPVPSKKNQLN